MTALLKDKKTASLKDKKTASLKDKKTASLKDKKTKRNLSFVILSFYLFILSSFRPFFFSVI
ncbi:MAG: hypothetical protein COA40_10240 [Aequorivita sp.]|nr:MAG: hypothetical protein COA40_10240 [Aequorivita sp.]